MRRTAIERPRSGLDDPASTLSRTTGPRRPAPPGARSDYPSRGSTLSPCPFWCAALLPPAVKGHAMATGTVKWFNEQKGYGFIQPDQGGKDVFVHISAVERSGLRSLRDGQKVSYDVEADRRTGKESATNLKAM